MAMKATPPDLDTLPASAMLTDADVAALFRVSRSCIWRWQRQGRIPVPVRVGENCTRWQAGPLREALARMVKQAA